MYSRQVGSHLVFYRETEEIDMVKFTDRNGNELEGKITRQYAAFEGGMRYIISTGTTEYRCVKNENGELVELVV